MSQPSTWTKTLVASMTSYIDAGSIVAGGAGLALWQAYLGLTDSQVGLVAACSSNAMSAAVGALIGGKICDHYGRKFVYTYDLLFYILGMLMIISSTSFPLLLAGYIIVGLAVGADVVASWTLIAENAPAENRAKHCGTAQFMWALGPAVVLILSAILTFSLSEPKKDLQLKNLNGQTKVLIERLSITDLCRLGLGETEEIKKIKRELDEVSRQKTIEVMQRPLTVKSDDARLKEFDKQIEELSKQLPKAEKQPFWTLVTDTLTKTPEPAWSIDETLRPNDRNNSVKSIKNRLKTVFEEKNALSEELAEKYLLGNKIVFGHLVVIALIVWLIRLRMPESEGWKKEQELLVSGAIQKPKYSDLFTIGANLKAMTFLISVYMIWNWAAGTWGFFLPWIFKNAGGVSDTVSQALPVILFIVSCFSTYFIFMSLADKYSRRAIFGIVALCFVAAWGLFFLPPSMLGVPVFIAVCVLIGINNGSGQQAFYQMWSSELFPARYRASAQGFMFFAARICLGVWSFFMPIIATRWGMPAAMTFLVCFSAVSLLIGTIFCPNTAGKTLEQIEQERYGK